MQEDSDQQNSIPSIAHELFVVEGLSAANALDNVVDKATQFIYPMQGKPMNVVRARPQDVLANERAGELYRRIVRNRAEGYDPDPASDAQPFARVILLADADVDGVHAKALLLVMIDHLFPDIVEDQMLCTVRAPLFGVMCDQLDHPIFAYSSEGRDSVFRQLAQQKATGADSTHYKGIASMNADDIWHACANPETRHLTTLTTRHVAAARSALDH